MLQFHTHRIFSDYSKKDKYESVNCSCDFSTWCAYIADLGAKHCVNINIRDQKVEVPAFPNKVP